MIITSHTSSLTNLSVFVPDVFTHLTASGIEIPYFEHIHNCAQLQYCWTSTEGKTHTLQMDQIFWSVYKPSNLVIQCFECSHAHKMHDNLIQDCRTRWYVSKGNIVLTSYICMLYSTVSHKQVHSKRGVKETLHVYINRARLTVCEVGLFWEENTLMGSELKWLPKEGVSVFSRVALIFEYNIETNMTSTTESFLQTPPVHWQLTQLECPTFPMSGGWLPQPGSRYPGCHAALDTCHRQPDEGIQLPVNNLHVFMCTTISLDVSHQYK